MAKKEKFVVTTRWRKLTSEQQVAEVRQAMLDRHTNKTAAKELGATPGIIAGIRFKNKIPPREKSSNEPSVPAPSAQAGISVPLPAPPARTESTPEETPRYEHAGKVKLATSEANQCVHRDERNIRCGHVRLPGSDFCEAHK